MECAIIVVLSKEFSFFKNIFARNIFSLLKIYVGYFNKIVFSTLITIARTFR